MSVVPGAWALSVSVEESASLNVSASETPCYWLTALMSAGTGATGGARFEFDGVVWAVLGPSDRSPLLRASSPIHPLMIGEPKRRLSIPSPILSTGSTGLSLYV